MHVARMFAVCLALTACASENDKPSGQWTPGKGDGAFELFEAGPAPTGGSVDTGARP